MILPYNSISRYNRRKLIDKVKVFKSSFPKFKIGQIVNYHGEFDDGKDKIIIDYTGIVIGYVFDFGEGHYRQKSSLGEWRYYLYWIDSQICDYSQISECDLTAV